MTATVSIDLPAGALLCWLREQRWFAAKDSAPRSLTVLSSTDFTPGGRIVLVDVELDTSETQRYQLVIGVRSALPASLAPALIARIGDRCYYDGLADPRLCTALLARIATGAALGPIEFAPESRTISLDGAPRLVGAEQSNTSVVFGDRHILKVFRRIWPGQNPELELRRALHEAGSTQVATLAGAVHASTSDGAVTLAVLQDYAPDTRDGWAIAQGSLRALLATDRVDGLAGELRWLGGAVAAVHADLAGTLGSEPMPKDIVVDRLLVGMATALRVAPDLAAHSAAVRGLIADVRAAAAALPPQHTTVQRLHGDLHLGQVLRTPGGWLLIDFEGEPGRPISERVVPDSPLRDVAGILRSLDYVMGHQAMTTPGWSADHERVANQWVARNQRAFLDGYAAVSGVDPRESGPLLLAYQLDKALYEVGYEARNRPQWIQVPLRAVAALIGDEHAAG